MSKLAKLQLSVLSGIAVFMSQTVWADTSEALVDASLPAAGESTTTSKSTYEEIQEKVSLVYFGVYRGASLEDVGNAHQPTPDGTLDPNSPQSVENLITGGYKLTPDLMIGAALHFNYFPSLNPSGKYGQDLQMLDPMLVISKANMIATSNFHLTGKVFFQFPFSSADILLMGNRNLAAAIIPTVVANYEVPGTKLTLGTYAYIRAYVPSAGSPEDAPTYKIYVAPYLSYQMTQTVAATLWVDLVQAQRKANTPFIGGIDNYAVDIEPGISWDITKFLTFNPILNIYPSKLTLAATSIQAIIVAKAF
jgi:hypothetical protein